jgi:hypothetical protein
LASAGAAGLARAFPTRAYDLLALDEKPQANDNHNHSNGANGVAGDTFKEPIEEEQEGSSTTQGR